MRQKIHFRSNEPQAFFQLIMNCEDIGGDCMTAAVKQYTVFL